MLIIYKYECYDNNKLINWYISIYITFNFCCSYI